jgi:hypothetical protein
MPMIVKTAPAIRDPGLIHVMIPGEDLAPSPGSVPLLAGRLGPAREQDRGTLLQEPRLSGVEGRIVNRLSLESSRFNHLFYIL